MDTKRVPPSSISTCRATCPAAIVSQSRPRWWQAPTARRAR